ncbi:50S ribosomal protein L25 [bacterium]|nr:50S ribosomal protein L25 [bacterium]
MERATLHATKRQAFGTRAAQRVRNEGLVPIVLYGHGRDTVHLTVTLDAVERLLHSGARMVDLEIGGTVEPALLKDLQYDAMGDYILHLDLARVSLDEKVRVTIPVVLHGTPKGMNAGGILDHGIQDIEVECLALNIPEHILVEIADMDIADVIHVRELSAPEGVTFTIDADTPVVTVHPPAVVAEEEDEEGTGVDLGAEPEIIGRSAEEDGEQEG